MTIRKFTVPERPVDEPERQAALDSYRLAGQRADPELDAIVAEAAAAFAVPIALVSLVDRDIQWFPARVGLPLESTPRSISFCGHAINHDGPFIVPDATADERFAGNPLVIEADGIRFYAGAPLTTRDGFRIGTLCLIDRKPRATLSDAERRRLVDLGARVMETLEARRHA
jgi:GAF domain-containing protein